MLKVVIDYPTIDEEKRIILENLSEHLPTAPALISADEIMEA